ncbi:MAG: hypothetical protein AB2A00_29140 [Myxococcota bacterium]
MFASERNCVVAVHATQLQAELAAHQLRYRGIPMSSLSLVGRPAAPRVRTGSDDSGRFESRLERELCGSGLFLVPGVGALLVGGPLVAAMMRSLESPSSRGTREALHSGLGALGVPAANLRSYEELLKTGYFMVIAHGTARMCMTAKAVLDRDGPPESRLHSM